MNNSWLSKKRTEVHFEGIQNIIIDKILSSKKWIKVAVAWLSDNEIVDALIQKCQEGLIIEILLDKNEKNHKTFINLLPNSTNIKVKLVHNMKSDMAMMHHKFALFDGKTAISGSYNWTRNAKSNYENLVVIYDQMAITHFKMEFQRLQIGKIMSRGDLRWIPDRTPEWLKLRIQMRAKLVEMLRKGISDESLLLPRFLVDFEESSIKMAVSDLILKEYLEISFTIDEEVSRALPAKFIGGKWVPPEKWKVDKKRKEILNRRLKWMIESESDGYQMVKLRALHSLGGLYVDKLKSVPGKDQNRVIEVYLFLKNEQRIISEKLGVIFFN